MFFKKNKFTTKSIGSFSFKVGFYLSIIFISLGGILFLSQKIKAEVKNIKEVQVRIKKSSEFLESLQELQLERKKAQECQKRLTLLMPKEIDSPTLMILRQLNILARQAGVGITVNFENEKDGAIPISISLQGSQENVIKFFELIKKGQFFLSIENFNWDEENNEVLVIAKGFVRFKVVSKEKSKNGK